MTFDKALKALKKGKQIYRSNNKGKGMYYNYELKNGRLVYAGRGGRVLCISDAAILADNWEVISG